MPLGGPPFARGYTQWPGVHDLIAPNALWIFPLFRTCRRRPYKGVLQLQLRCMACGGSLIVFAPLRRLLPGGCGNQLTQRGNGFKLIVAANPRPCAPRPSFIARFYSSTSADATPAVQPFWQILFNAGADLVINGHAHNYERFRPAKTPTAIWIRSRAFANSSFGNGRRNSNVF